ncbi:pentatricopeptide repeat-containing protein At3g49170, chloroplastic [Mangifera indica]|uniref:pentatricopeptide repeat-containing protein At3g49170, chloroplastic n=1 Tax=Mangifera indica TaxID=29780 RepID=UPI001CF9C7D9|nr:pentatricopeptide repeat-containing protein At3g49170, chloroplastic [Mangifera indica]
MITLSLPAPAKIPLPSCKPSKPSRQNLPLSSSSLTPLIKQPHNFEPLNSRLIQHLNEGHLQKAISTLDLMTQHNTYLDLLTYSLLLKLCIRSRAFDIGRYVHSHLMTHSKLEPNSVILNSLISLYSKCGNLNEASMIFETMGEKRDLVSWSSMISCFANNGKELDAVTMFVEMLERGFYPNEYCFTAVVRACSNMENFSIGKIVFGFLLKCGYFESDVCVGCALIDMFVKGGGDLESGFRVFDNMPERNVVSWTLMITRCVKLGYARDGIGLFQDMILSGFLPDRFTLSAVVSGCSELELLTLGQQLHSWVIRAGLAYDVCIGCSMVDMYAKCTEDGSMGDSRKVFDRMLDHNVMSWTAIITGYVQSGGCDEEAIKLFCDMIQGGHVAPNHFTLASVLKACGNLLNSGVGEQVYTHAVKRGLALDNCVGNSLISMYARSGMMDDARKAFDSLFEKNLVSYNTMVEAYAKNLNSEEAFEVFNEIEDSGVGVSAHTFASLLSGASCIGAASKGEQIHARIIKSGFESNHLTCNALISMYSRCGNIEAAFQVFKEMDDRNVISWTSMITAFAKHGSAARALEVFREMLEAGIRPNGITYIAVLSACSHVGLISEGWKLFRSMHEEHGILPRMEHYACMVDLLGRSGSLIDALEFIRSMPFMADALVWRTFLGACHVHGDTVLGKHAAEMILEQDPNDPAAYILLSNLYASAGQWDDVADIRKIMKERNLIKEAGCSWIEVENKVHKFHVGETCHPQAQEIYAELDQLALKIKELGYIPNTNFVLHELEEEKKVQYLFQHSEKIAVAFGLISTPRSKPIRVFKNLRVCRDCHTAIKYISAATSREIVLRDSNRFHHIKDGACSCNDYW